MSSNHHCKEISIAVGAAASVALGYFLYKKYWKKEEKCECNKPEEEATKEDDKPQVIFLLGGPGSGKGTVSSTLKEKLGWIPISAGDCLREEKESGSKDAELINDYIKKGLIVPGEITINLLLKKIRFYEAQGQKKIIIDGFPRSMENLEGWNKLVGDKVHLHFILLLECSEEVMTERCLQRGKTSGRVDDNPESLVKRFKTHMETSMPVINLFDEKGMVKRINANRTREEVAADAIAILKDL